MGQKIRAVVSDLDGTLLDGNGSLSPETRRVLRILRERGIPVIVATGRPLCALPEQVQKEEGIPYLITANGAQVYARGEEKVLYETGLSYEIRQQLFNAARETDAYCEAFLQGQAYLDSRVLDRAEEWNYGPRVIRYLQSTRRTCQDLESLVLEAEQVEALDFFARDPEHKSRIWERVSRISGLYVTSSVPHLVEVAAEGTNKAQALKWVLEKLHISSQETIAFGDGDNDVELLQICGLGIAMENGSHACRAAADRIAAGNQEDGFAREIGKLLEGVE